MKKIIGLGSNIRTRDRFGILVIDKLKKHNLPDDVNLEKIGPDIFTLVSSLEDAEKVIIADAIKSGNNPGELNIYSEKDLPDSEFSKFSVHHINLFEILKISQNVLEEKKPDSILIVGLNIEDLTSLEESIPSVIEKSANKATEILLSLVKNL